MIIINLRNLICNWITFTSLLICLNSGLRVTVSSHVSEKLFQTFENFTTRCPIILKKASRQIAEPVRFYQALNDFIINGWQVCTLGLCPFLVFNLSQLCLFAQFTSALKLSNHLQTFCLFPKKMNNEVFTFRIMLIK